jgi:hypothetical protein
MAETSGLGRGGGREELANHRRAIISPLAPDTGPHCYAWYSVVRAALEREASFAMHGDALCGGLLEDALQDLKDAGRMANKRSGGAAEGPIVVLA